MYLREKVHFIGIGGIGMSGLAQLLLELGYVVSGSDLQVSEITERLVSWGAEVKLGHVAANLAHDVQAVVVSSAIPPHNPEIIKAQKLGIPIMQRAEILGMLMNRQKGIAVAGTHGKTTTTSLIALLFEQNNYDPTIVLGGQFNNLGSNAKLGQGEFFIAEADESDASFLKLNPLITVVTNIEDDHLDFYGSREKIQTTFSEFILKTPAHGFVVLCIDDPGVREIIPDLKGKIKIITYGFSPQADYQAKNVVSAGFQSHFTVVKQARVCGEIVLNMPGEYNVLNALAAVAVGSECGLSFEKMAASLLAFRGISRRFEKIGIINGIHIYDDFAHHPSELKATLAAAKKTGFKRVVAIFQPHRFSRTQALKTEFGTAFRDADLLVFTDIFAAGEKPLPGVNSQTLIAEIKKQTGQQVKYLPNKKLIAEKLLNLVKPGDLVLTLGAGDIRQIGFQLLTLLESANSAVPTGFN